jgi:hypothetical protein
MSAAVMVRQVEQAGGVEAALWGNCYVASRWTCSQCVWDASSRTLEQEFYKWRRKEKAWWRRSNRYEVIIEVSSNA